MLQTESANNYCNAHLYSAAFPSIGQSREFCFADKTENLKNTKILRGLFVLGMTNN